MQAAAYDGLERWKRQRDKAIDFVGRDMIEQRLFCRVMAKERRVADPDFRHDGPNRDFVKLPKDALV